MSQRRHNFAIGEFFHIYNRGIEKRIIFQDEHDHDRFQLLLHVSNNKDKINLRDLTYRNKDLYQFVPDQRIVAIGAYCLMPNHFHLLLTPLVEDGVSIFMQRLATSYSMYFNKKHERSGSLFEGKFKSKIADNDTYLRYLYSYILLNPVKLLQRDWKECGIRNKQKAVQFLRQYPYSSLHDELFGNRKEGVILNRAPFPLYFESINRLERELHDWLEISNLSP